MYLMQIVAFHGGRCGAPVADVIRTAAANGTPEMVTRLDIDQALRTGRLVRVSCDCQ